MWNLIPVTTFKAKDREGYGCLMLYLDIPSWEETVLNRVKKEDLWEVEGEHYGKETQPHITILYGFHTDECHDFKIVEAIKQEIKKPIKVQLNKVSLFENSDDFDVLKFDIECPVLTKLNTYMKGHFPYTNSYDGYHAHATIAYIKKGLGKEYLNKFDNVNFEVESNHIVYSKPGREKINVKI